MLVNVSSPFATVIFRTVIRYKYKLLMVENLDNIDLFNNERNIEF